MKLVTIENVSRAGLPIGLMLAWPEGKDPPQGFVLRPDVPQVFVFFGDDRE